MILPSSEVPTLDPSMASVAGFPAKTSAALALVSESPMAPEAASGPITRDLLANYDRASSSWKTSQRCFIEEWTAFSETWPRSGMMQSGNAYQQPPLVPRISGTEFGFLPTPDKSLGAFEGFSRGNHGMDANSLFLKETVGERPSGAKIGSSLRWCPDFIREWLRTGGSINPVWTERLMGFPDNWTELGAAEIPSSPKSRKSSGGQS